MGKAQQAYAGLSVTDDSDFGQLKSAILPQYDIAEESYRQRFRAAKPRPGESNRELAARLEDLADKWMKTCTSIEELRDLVVLEQLLNMLPEDARIFVKEREPRTSMEAGRLADDYIVARKDEAAEKGEEEKAPDRRQSLRCGKCRKLGHLARDCRQSQPKLEREKDKGEAARRPKDIECFNCHQKGHYASNCPSNALFCSERLPGKVGEQTRTGTELTRKGSVEGKAVDHILLDTGCSRTLVHQELVQRSKMLDGEAVAIRCAHGDTVLYPVALLQVVVGTRTMEVRAVVSETLPVDVLLGTDVPELPELLCTDFSADAMAVMTRAQRCQMLTEEEKIRQKEQESGASSTGVDDVGGECPALMMTSLAEDRPEPDNPERRSVQNNMPMPRTWQKVMTQFWLMLSQKRTRTLLTSRPSN